MTEQHNKLAKLFAACWKDAGLKARFMANPAEVLAEYDMPVPEGIDIKVVENQDDCVHITLPMAPEDAHELSDDQLASAAGGCLAVYNSTDHTKPGNGCTAGRLLNPCNG